jgi:hypothetical protein
MPDMSCRLRPHQLQRPWAAACSDTILSVFTPAESPAGCVA